MVARKGTEMIVDGGYLTFKLSFGGFNIWEDEKGKDVKILAWDSNPIRKSILPTYKEHRKEGDEIVLRQVREMRDEVKQFSRMPVCEIDNCEADDIVSAYYIFNPEMPVIGIDKDYFQLPNLAYTYSYRYEPYTKAGVLSKVPIYLQELAQSNFALYQMLYGDSSDGIPRLLARGKRGKEQVEDILSTNNLCETLQCLFEDAIFTNAALILFPWCGFGEWNDTWFEAWCAGDYYNPEHWKSFYELIKSQTRESGPYQLGFEEAYLC